MKHYYDEEPRVPQLINKKTVWGIIGTFIALIFLCFSFSLFEDADKTKNYVCQYPITGNYEVWMDGGLQWQGCGNVSEYQKTSQIGFSGYRTIDGGVILPDGDNPVAQATFNDKGKGYIIGSFRVNLPRDAQHMEKIQTDFGSERELINSLVRPTLYKVITACGPLMSSLQSVSETRTDLQNYIQDQLNNGVFKTKLVKVEQVNELTGEKEVVTIAEIINDTNSPGGYKRQEVSPFSIYGISADVVSITDILYDPATQQQIDAQKQANLAVITSKTRAIEATQKTIQIAEEGKAAAEKARWEQEREKAVQVTKAEQEREVSRLAAEKAEFDKKKIIAQGEAEAAANRAKVAAGLTPQEKAEWDYKTAVGIAQALADSKVRWVPEIVMSGGGSSNSAMDAVGLNMMLDVVQKMNKK